MTFSFFAKVLSRLEETASRNTMTEILADLFREASPSEIGEMCYLLQGRTTPLFDAVEFGIADKFMIRAIALAYVCDESLVRQQFSKMGDLGKTAEVLHKGRGKLTVSDVYKALDFLSRESGTGSQEKKIGLLADILKGVDGLSARYVARIPLDKLRLGFSDMTILDALSWMIAGDKSLRPRLEEAYNVRPDIGFIAQTIKKAGIKGLSQVHARIGVPILAALCQRLPNADEMIKKMDEVAVEPKYDGVRVQIHVTKHDVKSFSRNLERTTDMFPELGDIRKQLDALEVILDSEAIGVDPKTGKLIPFQETMTRKRKHGISAAQASVPLQFFVFDILYKDQKDLLSTPLSDRRKVLEQTIKKGNLLVISPQIVTRKAQEIREYHDAQIKKGLEGAVVKKWHSPYEPGRKGYSWVKFKEEEGKTGKLTDTIDAVIMGYNKGEGKRSGFGIGAFLVGVARGDAFVTVTKIGTGVSDELWKELRTKLNTIKTTHSPKQYVKVAKMLIPDVWVAPKIVVEIAGDDLTRSPNHGAGFAVRFPRLVRIRTDKSPREVTTVEEIKRMFANQGGR